MLFCRLGSCRARHYGYSGTRGAGKGAVCFPGHMPPPHTGHRRRWLADHCIRAWGKDVVAFETTDIRTPITGIALAGDLCPLSDSAAPCSASSPQEPVPSRHRRVGLSRKRLSDRPTQGLSVSRSRDTGSALDLVPGCRFGFGSSPGLPVRFSDPVTGSGSRISDSEIWLTVASHGCLRTMRAESLSDSTSVCAAPVTRRNGSSRFRRVI